MTRNPHERVPLSLGVPEGIDELARSFVLVMIRSPARPPPRPAPRAVAIKPAQALSRPLSAAWPRARVAVTVCSMARRARRGRSTRPQRRRRQASISATAESVDGHPVRTRPLRSCRLGEAPLSRSVDLRGSSAATRRMMTPSSKMRRQHVVDRPARQRWLIGTRHPSPQHRDPGGRDAWWAASRRSGVKRAQGAPGPPGAEGLAPGGCGSACAGRSLAPAPRRRSVGAVDNAGACAETPGAEQTEAATRRCPPGGLASRRRAVAALARRDPGAQSPSARMASARLECGRRPSSRASRSRVECVRAGAQCWPAMRAFAEAAGHPAAAALFSAGATLWPSPAGLQ